MLLILTFSDVMEGKEETTGEGGFSRVDVTDDDQGEVRTHAAVAIASFVAVSAVDAERSERGKNGRRDLRYRWRLFDGATAAAASIDWGEFRCRVFWNVIPFGRWFHAETRRRLGDAR